MKKSVLLSLLACLFVLFSCSKEAKMDTVSFLQSNAINRGGLKEVSVSSTYQGSSAVDVMLEFSGTAVKGKDYTVSSEKFVLGGPNPVSNITITPLVFGVDKSVIIKIVAPHGFQLGKISSLTISLGNKLGIVSFKLPKIDIYEDAEETPIVIGLYDNQNKLLKTERKLPLIIGVDPSSTAVEGENFEFVNKEDLAFAPSSSEAILLIKPKKYDKAKNKLVLRISEDNAYDIGSNYKINITLREDVQLLMSTKWRLSAISPSKKDFTTVWGLADADMAGYPVIEDGQDNFITLDFAKNLLTTDFKNTLKNFFKESSAIVKDGKFEVRDIGVKKEINRYSLDNVNRYFSATEQSEDRQAYIALELAKDDKEEDVLLLYLIDYNSKTFAVSMAEFLYKPEKPTVTDQGSYMTLSFKRAE